jgi:DNA polymerase elongation subunit (family B)
MNNNPRVLVFDIETAPMLAYVWGLRDQNIALNSLKQEWYVLGWSAKWLGDPPSKVVYYDQRKAKDKENDKAILLPLWKLLDEADIVITQNGKNFDSPKLNARFIIHGMPPPSPYQHLDTYQIVRKVAKFTSNKLEYLTNKLCTKYKKLRHTKYPGFSLWTECLAGNLKAWEEMKKYNIHDVLSTEELYLKIRAWTPKSMPDPYHSSDPERQCGKCGEMALWFQGRHRNKKGLFKKLHCRHCGAWLIGARIDG